MESFRAARNKRFFELESLLIKPELLKKSVYHADVLLYRAICAGLNKEFDLTTTLLRDLVGDYGVFNLDEYGFSAQKLLDEQAQLKKDE